ncbi:uncharacterized protein [Vulpes vulpes]|uniref:Uncharacterized protein n=1 Tax=Vulpes vulpes TaxID=9627 RepID=A0ABM5AA03_VULVU
MRRGLGESQRGPWTQMLLPGARADRHALAARPLFVPGSSFSAWRSRSPLSTPPPGRSAGAKSCALRARLAEGSGGAPSLAASEAPGASRALARRALSPGPSSAPCPAEPVGRVPVVCVCRRVCVSARAPASARAPKGSRNSLRGGRSRRFL